MPSCKDRQNTMSFTCVSAEDNVPNLSQIFDAYAKILRRPSFLKEKGITDPTTAAKFIYKVILLSGMHVGHIACSV